MAQQPAMSIGITVNQRSYKINIHNVDRNVGNIAIDFQLPDDHAPVAPQVPQNAFAAFLHQLDNLRPERPAEPVNPVEPVVVENRVDVNRVENPSDSLQESVQQLQNLSNELVTQNNDADLIEDNTEEEYHQASDSDEQQSSYDHELQKTITQSLLTNNIYEEQASKNFWIPSTGHLSPIFHATINFANSRRSAISFDALIKHHPKRDSILSQEGSYSMYQEIFSAFDTWIRQEMNDFPSEEDLQDLQAVDYVFGAFLLKFPKTLTENAFRSLIRIFDNSIKKDSRSSALTEKLKTVIVAIREGVLNDIIKLLDPGNCNCTVCSI